MSSIEERNQNDNPPTNRDETTGQDAQPPTAGDEQAQSNNDDATPSSLAPDNATKTVTPPIMPADWTQLACDQAPVIRYPTDVAGPEIWDATETDTILLVGTSGQKITNLGPDFSSTLHPQLRRLVLRSHLIANMQGLTAFQALQLLELYDNQIEELQGLDGAFGKTLVVLDMSYNVIRDMSPVHHCPNLTELCEYVSKGENENKCTSSPCRNDPLSHCKANLSTFCDQSYTIFTQQIWPITNSKLLRDSRD